MKTTIKYMILLCCACLMSNCNNDLYDSPRGALTISSTTVTAGEPVTFTWNGDGDHIVFYSGELKHEYKYKDRKRLIGIPEVSFEYRNYKGDLPWERGDFKFYYSTDYTGENFESATWNDITDRFNIGEGKNSYQKTGYVRMEELQGHHATFAFEGIYNGGNPVDIGWGNFKIRSYSPELESYVDLLSVAKDTPGIVTKNNGEDPSAHIWELNTNWRFKLPQGVSQASKTPETGWCILPTQSFEDAQYPGDEGEVKKTLSAEALPWTHVYPQPGVYTATVVVSCYDSGSDQRNETIAEYQITVLEKPKEGLEISSTNIEAGDIVTFSWYGNENSVDFFSGLPGHEYKNKDGKELNRIPQIKFKYRNYKETGWDRGHFEVLYATDYNGTNAETANWVNITERLNIPEDGNNVEKETSYVKLDEISETNTTFAFKGICNKGKVVDIGWRDFIIGYNYSETGQDEEIQKIGSTSDVKTIDKEGAFCSWRVEGNMWRYKSSLSGTSPEAIEGWCILPTYTFTNKLPADTPEQKTGTDGVITWETTYTQPGRYTITIVVGNQVIEKTITVE